MEIEALAKLIILITWLPVGLLSVWLVRKTGFEIPKPKWIRYVVCAITGYLGLFGVLLVLLAGECFLSDLPEVSVIRFDENGKPVR